MPSGHPGPQAWEGDMYNHDGQNLFVIDSHMHFWDANPENWKTNTGRAGSNAFTRFTAGSARQRRYGRSKSFVDMMKRRWPTTCSEAATSTWLSSTRHTFTSSTRTASTLTSRTTSSKPSIRIDFYCAVLLTRGMKSRGSTRSAG